MNKSIVTSDREDTMEDVDEESPLLTPQTKREGSTQSNIHSITPLPWMHIRCYRIRSTDGRLDHCSLEECLQHRRRRNEQDREELKTNPIIKNDAHYWIDIEADWNPQRQPLYHKWLLQLGLPVFALEILARSPETWFSQVIPLPRAALALLRILPSSLSSDSDELQHSAALYMSSILLTLTTTTDAVNTADPPPSLHSQIYQRMQQRLHVPSSGGALMAWLGFHLEKTSHDTRTLRSSVLDLDESMDKHGVTSVEVSEILRAKEQVMRLLSVAEEQTECLESLTALNLEELRLPPEQDSTMASLFHASLPILLAMTRATERLALRLEQRVMDLRRRLQTNEQEKMNRRLGVLTVLSAVFLPLTLFTGIWGMNFENMPELNKPYSYPLALLFMIMIAFTMISYFWKAGWFR
ncbi:unnamed protein product [Cylindrotheca closterium]|uniref:Magnesium transporter n=1 Tax=Cylindrotheca closterium TaxID=2856 RepID=A0AAD2CMW0_9STRA|nr:unnamed protein product [Cylindrotheca closterium]